MRVIGQVESLWRYPVKSMRGEEMQEAFVGFAGVYGDRVYAFQSAAAAKGFPYFTGREQESMLLYRPSFRHAEPTAKPSNLTEAEAMGSGVTPVYPDLADFIVDVETPAGERFAIDDPQLMSALREGIDTKHQLTLLRSHRAMTDCRPVSIFSLQTVRQLSKEVGFDLDKRRFRANIYANLESVNAFGEDDFVGRHLRIGARTTIAVVNRDSRCKMITLDPDTSRQEPEIMKRLYRDHEGKAGIYGAVLAEGTVRRGDEVALLD
jgi:uncharacterized protein YcbX